MVAISRPWYNGSYTTAANPIKSLELHYTMIQFLIMVIELSAIWSEIIRVISKSNERAARVRFEITSKISDQNYTTRSSITYFEITQFFVNIIIIIIITIIFILIISFSFRLAKKGCDLEQNNSAIRE